MKHITSCRALALALAACGGATNTSSTPEPTPAAVPPPPRAAEPEAKPVPAAEPTNDAVAAPAPPAEPTPEPCDGGWVCVKVSFDTKKVEPRETKLLGDPKIEQTWSKSSDGRTASFDAFSKGPVELTLRRKPGNKNEVVVKLGKGEVVIDRRDGTIDDFTHVGAIAAEQDGALLVDLRYMK